MVSLVCRSLHVEVLNIIDNRTFVGCSFVMEMLVIGLPSS